MLCLLNESTFLRFRHMLKAQKLGQHILIIVNDELIDYGLVLKNSALVDATLIKAPSSTKNEKDELDLKMHQTKKSRQWHFGIKANISVEAESFLVLAVTTTAANVDDVLQADVLLHYDTKFYLPTRVTGEFKSAKNF